MIKAIRISKITRVAGGYQLEISTCDQPLIITDELRYRHQLKAGIVLTESQLQQLTAEAETARCEQVAGRLLAMRDHTVGELRAKLKRRKFQAEAVGSAIKKYQASGILDDARVAHDLARRLLAKKPAGRSYLVAALQKKKVERALAEKVVNLLLEDQDDTAAAVMALKQKWPVPDQIDIESVRSKAYSYLSRRGFGYGAARAAVAQLFETEDKVEED